MIIDLFEKSKKGLSFELENINVSYILFCQIEGSIYAMTAGFGNHLIKNYIERNWGLYLMPKILGDDVGVIREVKENNLYGNEISLSKANRYTTNLVFEKKMSAVFRELSLEVDDEVAELFGISSKENTRKTSVLLKDSLNLRKSISIAKLKEVLNEIYEIEKREDQYSMGYFSSSKKANISNADLFDALQDCILNGELDKFILIGDDYQKYYVDASEYIVTDDKGEECYTSNSPISFVEFIEFISEHKELSKSRLTTILKKWNIQTKDDNGNTVMFPRSILNSLQGFVEFSDKNIPCFLMQGDWYCFINRYTSMLDEEFKSLFEESKEASNDIHKRFGLASREKTEDSYNDSFFENENIIVGHKALINNFEIADLIFWDDTNLYLMCNKKLFNGAGSRDLTNQMWAAANYLQTRLNSKDRTLFLTDYYKKINSRYTGIGHTLEISKSNFYKLFDKRIIFIAGYMSGYSKRSDSYYAKYLTVDTHKKIQNMGCKCITMGIQKVKKE